MNTRTNTPIHSLADLCAFFGTVYDEAQPVETVKAVRTAVKKLCTSFTVGLYLGFNSGNEAATDECEAGITTADLQSGLREVTGYVDGDRSEIEIAGYAVMGFKAEDLLRQFKAAIQQAYDEAYDEDFVWSSMDEGCRRYHEQQDDRLTA